MSKKPGIIHQFEINPSVKKIYRNQSFAYKVEGSDENYFPVNLISQDVSYSLSEGFGAEISDSGLFTAGNNPDTGYVFVEYNGFKDSSLVIIKGIRDFNLFPERAVTDDTKELVFSIHHLIAMVFLSLFQIVTLVGKLKMRQLDL